jgi:tRNA pseudouridine55 synthase
MNGVLVVDKPPGPTSHDVVAAVRRATGMTRVGHTGTLDPLATGVLPLLVGRATRLAQFMTSDDKEYIADVRLGCATPTYDAEAQIRALQSGTGHPLNAAGAAASISTPAIDQLLSQFRGTYWQTPPPFSAKKVAGTAAYRLARMNRPVALKPVQVTVNTLEMVSRSGDTIRIRIVCSTGFYVRTLAHELGQRLRCGAHLEALRRTRAGGFDLDDAVALATIVETGTDVLLRRLIPMDRLLLQFPYVVLNEQGASRAAHGNLLSEGDLAAAPAGGPASSRVRLIDGAGRLIGIADVGPRGVLHPVVVLV